jgi:hypothetical protein
MGEELEPGFLVPANVPGQAQSRTSKARLDAILETRRARPTKQEWAEASAEPLAWEAMYYDLLEEKVETKLPNGAVKLVARWDWRKALYIAWSSVPASKRWPRFESELIDLLGLNNTATIRKWKASDPEIEQRILAGPKKLLGNHIAEVLEALVTVAKDPDPKSHPDRRLFLELTGQYNPKGTLGVVGAVATGDMDDLLSEEEQMAVEKALKELAAQVK